MRYNRAIMPQPKKDQEPRQNPLPQYKQIAIEAIGDGRDVDAALAVHLLWVARNAERWIEAGQASPGMVSDAILRNAKERLELQKSNRHAGEFSPLMIQQLMSGKLPGVVDEG